ncbi:DUF6427 family protein [Lutimonas zeaxanthinifaciens]|uniref:DUF6427 family protein n=1 Tax=Lutimonas zeaxanthinifaciens TaxID=3060215 RepID=UPI00265CF6A5|nr:DUF6427 family protein [Lutimonas sp. YSD2104]WKK66090.1 DUF6427 family protein [Lutimonas sp. YSD2104]
MIANFFSKTKPINFLLLSILVVIIFIVAVINVNSEPLSLYLFAKNGLFLFFSILTLFILNFIIRKNGLTEDNSLAILFYILMISYFPNIFAHDGLFLSNFILLFAFRRIYSLRSSIETKEKIFDSSFWIGIASLFYIWSILFILIVYAGIVIFRKTDWRNFIIPLIGFITPVFLSYTYLLAFDDLIRFYELWDFELNMDISTYVTQKMMVPLVLIGVFAIAAIYPTTKRSLLAKIDFKSTWSLLLTHILVSLLVVLISPVKDGSEFLFLFFPLSILFANYLQVIERYWIRESIIYIFIIAVFSNFF